MTLLPEAWQLVAAVLKYSFHLYVEEWKDFFLCFLTQNDTRVHETFLFLSNSYVHITFYLRTQEVTTVMVNAKYDIKSIPIGRWENVSDRCES